MSNLLTLVKVNLRETLDKRKFRQNKKQQKFFAYIILMAILFIFISTLYSFIYANMYKAADALDRLFNLSLVFFGAASMMVFTSTVSKMQSIFIGNDYDILCSLPITKKDIVLSNTNISEDEYKDIKKDDIWYDVKDGFEKVININITPTIKSGF